MKIECPVIPADGHLPARFSRDGANTSPPLQWSDVPSAARELVVLFETVTPATTEPFAQWIVYGIGPDEMGLGQGFSHRRAPQDGMRHGVNDIGNLGYDGPQGTIGETVHLRFRLLALDAPLGLDAGADRAAVLKAAEGHLVGEAELPADFRRSA